MARHEFVSYKLHNPIITSWNHNKLDYEQSKGHDNTMQLAIEAVSYGNGVVEQGDPEGFGFEHYDNTPSPLKGEIPPGSASFVGISPGSSNNIISTINTVAEQLGTYQSTQSNQNTGITPTVANLTQTSAPSVSGIQGFNFPTPNSSVSTTPAQPSSVGSLDTITSTTQQSSNVSNVTDLERQQSVLAAIRNVQSRIAQGIRSPGVYQMSALYEELSGLLDRANSLRIPGY
jgi:hypothetical protein